MTTSPTTLANVGVAEPSQPLLSRKGWGWLAVFGLLFVLLHLEFFRRMWIIATTDNNWSHALVVPLISVYYLFLHRYRLARTPQRLCWWGLPILFFGLLGYAWWVYPGRNDMFRGYCMILSLFGLTLLLLGPAMMKILWFPIAYLSFGVKISDAIWQQIAWKLQQIAAHGATVVLKFMAAIMDFDIRQQGTQLHLTFTKMVNGVPQTVTEPLNVAEACSGLRMLMAFIALGAALAFLFDRAWWQRVVMIAMAVPIALAVNIGRVAAIGVLFQFDQEKATGDFHIFVGMLMLIPAALLFLAVGWILDHLFLEDPGQTHSKNHKENAASPQANASQPPSHQSDRQSRLNSDTPTEAEEVAQVPLDKAAIGRGVGFGAALSMLLGLIYLQLLNLPAASPIVPWLTGAVGVAALIVLLVAFAGVIVLLRRAIPRRDRGHLRQRRNFGYGLAAAVLAVSLITQIGLLRTAGAVLVKQSIPLQRELFLMPTDNIGPWKVVRQDPPLPPAQEDELGTEKYISWYYLDTSMADPDDVDISRGEFPVGSVARVHVAYYTGNPDTVPHVPDRCFIAGGVRGMDVSLVDLNIDGPDYVSSNTNDGYTVGLGNGRTTHIPSTKFPATRFLYSRSGDGNNLENVIYFFAANGQFLPTPDRVRLQGFDLTDKYSYYCKVEVQLLRVADADRARERTEDLLQDLMPQIMASLPNWIEVKNGQYPSEQNTDQAKQ